MTKNQTSKTQKNVLSLFSGCGGMDLGFEGGFKTIEESINPKLNKNWIKNKKDGFVELKKTSFQTVFANDILNIAEQAWIPYFSKRGTQKEYFHKRSIVELVKDVELGTFKFPSKIDIVTGGFPCQDFSVAGKRKGFDSHKTHLGKVGEENHVSEENRGQLYTWMRKVIEITKPKMFIAENVKGLVSMGQVKDIISNDFKSIGNDGFFVADPQVLFAPQYGIAQRRERIIFIGINKAFLKRGVLKKLESGEINLYPPVTHYDPQQLPLDPELIPFATVSDALKNLSEPDETSDESQKKYSKAKYCPGTQGQIEVKLNGVSPTIRAEHHGNIEYRRLSKENGGKHIDELNQGLPERRLTVRECARIQTFPDDYEFVRNKPEPYPLSASSAYKVIGNAVPPLLAYHLAQHFESIWDTLF